MRQATTPITAAIPLRQAANVITIAIFLLLIGLPVLCLSAATWSDPLENRQSAELPSWPRNPRAVSTYIRGLEAYFNDHFGFRRHMIDIRTAIDFWVFRRSPADKVIIGRDNWLFYVGDRSVDDYMGRIALDRDKLSDWYTALKARRDWLKARGIEYYFVITPNKQMLYPEHMPAEIRKESPSQKEQLLSYLSQHGAQALVLDMYPALASAKGALPLYHPLDSHWNQYGGYVGYRSLVGLLNKNDPSVMRPVSIDQDLFQPKATRTGDLTAMMNFADYPYSTITTEYVGPPPDCVHPVKPAPVDTRGGRIEENTVECGEVDPAARALIFHDSMIVGLRSYLSQSFAHARFVRISPSLPDIESYVRAEHPKVVLEERMERGLLNTPDIPALAQIVLTDEAPPATRAGGMEIVAAGDEMDLSGFSLWRPAAAGTSLHLNTNLPIDDYVIEARHSPDVSMHYKDPILERARFTLRLYLKHGAPKPSRVRLCVWTDDPRYGATHIFDSTHPEWDVCPGR